MKSFMLLLGIHRSKYFLVALCTALMTGGEAVLHPLLLQAIFDAVEQRSDFRRFVFWGLCYFALGLTVNGLNYLISLWQVRLDNEIVAQTSRDLLRAYFYKRYNDVLREGGGYYVARIRSDVKDGLIPMLATVRKIVTSIITFALLVGVSIYISLRAFLILFVVILISAAVTVTVSRRIRHLTNIERDTEAALLTILTKLVHAFKMVCGFMMVPKALGTFSNSLDRALQAGYDKTRVITLLYGVRDLTMVISDVLSIFVGAVLVFRREMTIGSFLGFMNAFWRSSTTLISVFSQWADLRGYSATVDRLASFRTEALAAPYCHVGNGVLATALSFAYDTEPILSNFSIHIKSGERVLIIGKNGTGKTTLANILSGHLPPSAGQLELPPRISAITLPIHFPPIQVRELPIDLELLAAFGIDGPALLDTEPELLSAGQQQKVALALALSRDADLYVLDEPLANLDEPSRAVAMVEIQRRTSGRMLVMIMHHADEYKSAFDHVYCLEIKSARSERGSVVGDEKEIVEHQAALDVANGLA